MHCKVSDYFGDRQFNKSVLAVLIPIVVQNAVTNFVSLLDNLMVGRVGTCEMSGVAIANQLIFIYFLAVFGSISGAGIFTTQFVGAGDDEGVRHTMRYKLVISTLITVIFGVVFLLFGDKLVSLYLNESADPARERETLGFAVRYIRIILIGFLPYSLTQCYASTLRENGETAVPMKASLVAVGVNLVFNYLLIYGKFGFPCMGVAGAAAATVLSRYVELALIAVYSHTHAQKHPFVKELYGTLRIPRKLAGRITVRMLPLMMNEFMWAFGMATLNQIYSLRGLDTVAAMNITSTVFDLFYVACQSMGSASGIIIGRKLGACDIAGAKRDSRRLLTLAAMIGVFFGLLLFAFSGSIPKLYNTSDSIRRLATNCIWVCAAVMLVHGLANCEYFLLRSGGKTFVTFIFDSVFIWVISIPTAFVLTKFTPFSIAYVYLCVSLCDVFKILIGYILLRKGIWINNIVGYESGDGHE